MTDRNKRIRAGTYERAVLDLDRKAARDEDRTVPASLSSEAEVERWFGREILVHEPDAVDLTRANGLGLPLLWNHDSGTPIGRIENLRLDEGSRVLRGDLRFSRNAKASDVWTDVREGFLNAVSIGYRVQRWEEQEHSDLVRVVRWMPLEASVVSIPADSQVGINRSEDMSMPDSSNGQQTEQGAGREAVALDQYRSQFEAGKKAAAREIRAKEAERMLEIEDIFSNNLVPRDEWYRSLKATAIRDQWTPDKTRQMVMDALAGELPEDFVPSEPETTGAARIAAIAGRGSVVDMSRVTDTQQGIGRRGRAEAGEDQLDKFAAIVTDALLVRANMTDDKEVIRRVDESGYRNRSLSRLAGEYLQHTNRDIRALDDKGIAREVLSRAVGPHTSSDFPSILANVANKSTLRGWEMAGTTWQEWCNAGSLPDFKQATIARLGAYPDIDKIPASGGPYQHKSMDDIHETTTLETYGALFGISRHAIINDDLNEFTRVPQAMGGAAARKVNQLAYNELITSNGTTPSVTGRVLTQDSTALFDSGHSNYVASSSGAAPSVATLNTAEAAMMRQKAPLPSGDSSKAYIRVVPAYLIVPPELKATASTLIDAQWDPAGTTSSVAKRDAPNPWRNRLMVVADPDLSLATGWYLAAPRNGNIDTVTVFFLNGQSTPYVEQQDNWTSDGVTYKVRIDAVARALDFRGLYFNYGA